MKKLTLKEMTESEQREVKTELDKARKSHGRPLTNAEQHKVKDEVVARIMAARAKLAKAERAERKANRYRPSGEPAKLSPPLRGFLFISQTHPRYRIMNNNVINLL
ncbi:DUF3811 domain-containing protein [Serratia sarumanii]